MSAHEQQPPRQRIDRRRATQSEASRTVSMLPDDVVEAGAHRLGRVALVALIAVGAFYLLYTAIVSAYRGHWVGGIFDGVVIGMLSAICAAMYLASRSSRFSAREVLQFGLVWQVALAWLLGLIVNQIAWPEHSMPPAFSPLSVLILAYPLLVPGTPGKVLIAGLLAAAADPATMVLVAYLQEQPLPSGAQLAVRTLADVLCVVIAVIGSRLVHKLGREVAIARTMGSYELDTLIGKGGMGEVWTATHQMLPRPAAIKLIRSEFATTMGPGGVAARRFIREAESTASLRCPHTITVYDFGVTSDGTFFYVMELLDGVDLRSLVSQWGPLPVARTVHILRQACHSLHEAHERSFVHRDVKPANIFLCRYGLEDDFVKVLDFGLVSLVDVDDDPDEMLTRDGAIAGTPAVMAPELPTGEPATPAADVYALGCLAYWLLTGRLVFQAKSAVTMMMAHITETPEPPSKHRPDLPQDLDDLVMRCLAKAPESRPRDAGALLEALRHLGVPPWTAAESARWWDEHAGSKGVR